MKYTTIQAFVKQILETALNHYRGGKATEPSLLYLLRNPNGVAPLDKIIDDVQMLYKAIGFSVNINNGETKEGFSFALDSNNTLVSIGIIQVKSSHIKNPFKEEKFERQATMPICVTQFVNQIQEKHIFNIHFLEQASGDLIVLAFPDGFDNATINQYIDKLD